MYRRIVSLVALAAAVVAACSDGTSAESGRLSLVLTDAPGDFEKAVVTIEQIYIQPGEGSDNGRVVLMDDAVTVDLLTLANATADLVSDAILPAGSYTQLRFVVSGGYIEVENADGSTSIFASSPSYAGLPPGATVDGDLQMPSFAQSGIKVNLPGGAVEIAGDQKVLLVDFDVSQSFGHQAGQSGKWVMTPVLKATDFVASASLAITVSADDNVTMPEGVTLADFRVVLEDGDGSREELELTDANDDGVFEATFAFVAPGDYTIDLEAPEGVSFSTSVTLPEGVTITSGQTATETLVVTSVSQ